MDRHTSRGHSGNGASGSIPAPADRDAAEFAEYLRAERERRRLTLEQIADETKIAPRHLAALERGDVRNWPGGMYRRAMMRAYAESIGVDREFALKQFEQAFDVPPPQADALPPAAELRRAPAFSWRPTRNQALAGGASALTIAAIAVVWTMVASLTTGDSAPERTAPVAAAATSTSQPAAVAPPASGAPTPQPSTAPVATAAETAATTGSIPARPPAAEGTLVVESEPAGARVTVNGVGWGETPITIRHLEFGSKRIRLTLQDHVSEERRVTLAPHDASARLRLSLRRRN